MALQLGEECLHQLKLLSSGNTLNLWRGAGLPSQLPPQRGALVDQTDKRA
jgi:hypothetical protein